ncbi:MULTISPECIES: MFS transporter [Paraburkholderia]|uniref:MFS transporter n=1 Tax=Paraburkholderia TaxID=1822464 RepID=UPI001591FFC9|nr:MFS transporter [Paraburkholderia youngii]NUX57688.1 MFS transporter [Paraburkholderia youngii]
MKLFVKQGGDSVFSHKQGSTIAARLDRIPTHSFHTRLLGLVGGGMLIDNFDIYIAGSVLVVLLHSGWSTLSSNAAFVSATFAGMMIGTFAAGLIGDRYGRKPTFQINLAVFGLASIGAAAATNIDLLIAMRFICGVGLGAEIVTGYSTLAEFVPPQSRGKWLALLSMCSSCGLLTATLFSYLLIPIAGWRIMFAIPGVAALFVLWLRKAIPESPRWLEMRGRHAEADAIVCSIEDSARKTGATLASPAAFPMRTSESIWQLKFLRPLVLGTIMQVVLFTVLYALVAWLPTFLARQGMPINQSLKQSAIMALGGPVGAFVARLLADRLGRRKGIIFGSVIAAAMAAAFGHVSSPMVAMSFGFATYASLFYLLATVQAIYLPEIFPTEIRMRCNAVCVGIGRASAIGAPFVIVYLFEHGGVTAVITLIWILFAVQAVSMAVLGSETSRKPLDDVGGSPVDQRPPRSTETTAAWSQ